MQLQPHERIIVALDVERVSHARQIFEDLVDEVCWYKIGPHFYLDEEFSLFLHDILSSGMNGLFIDFKHLDTDKTVRMAIRQAVRRGATFATVHAHRPLMIAAVEEAKNSTLNVLAVPLLTSFGPDELLEFFNYRIPESWVYDPNAATEFLVERTRRAVDCGVKGVICSPLEILTVRDHVPDNILVITPGIVPAWGAPNEHKRTGTPRQAIDDGADLLVIGRPIVEADKPLDAFHRIVDEIT